MKNHFFIPYTGNKRQEVKTIYDNIKTTLQDRQIKTIVEPFCGTSALSFYISTQEPNKYNYVLNDNNNYLIELYEIARDENKLNILIEKLNEMTKDIEKVKYNALPAGLERFIIHNKIYQIRPGLFPTTKTTKTLYDFSKLNTAPIIHFLRTESITFSSIDAVELFDTYKDEPTAVLFLDPPYIESENKLYKTPTLNIYEHLYNNNINGNKSFIVLCLENIWIIKLLFKTNKTLFEYGKTYEMTKKKTTHAIITN